MALSDFVVVNISISASSSPTRQGFNTGLLAGYHNHYPDRVRVYTTAGILAALVADGYLTTEPLYLAAQQYASAPNAPSQIAIGRRALPPLQTLNLTCVDGTVGDKYSFTLVGSDGVAHALVYTNVVNQGPVIPGTALTGTVTVTNGSANITFSGNQTLAAGTLLTFSSQPGVAYQLLNAITAATAGTLTAIYTGATSSTATTTPNATTAVTNGSTAVTFSQAQTLNKGALLFLSSQPGVAYALSANVVASTSGTLTTAYNGTTNAAANTTSLAPLAGTFNCTNGSGIVPTTSSQVGTVAAGDSVMFSSQLGTTYVVASLTAAQLVLTTSYTGTTNATANAADVCTAATAATTLQATIAGFTNVGTPTVVGAVLTLSRTDGKLNDIQSWLSNGFASIQLDDATADPGIATDLAAIRAANNLAWDGLALDSNSEAEVRAAAAWAEATGVGGKFGFFNTSDYDNTLTSSTTDLFAGLQTLAYVRSFTQQNNQQLLCFAGAAIMGQVLAMNPGSYTAAYKTMPGVPADSDTTLTQAQAMALNTMTASVPGTGGKNGNYYKTVAGQNWLFPGTTPQGRFMDLTIGLDWLQVNMQADVAAVLAGLPKVPFDDNGIGVICDAIESRLRIGSTPAFGLILPDGVDAKRPIKVVKPKAAAVSPTDRGNRNLPNVSWSAGLAGAIETVSVIGQLIP